MTEPSLPSARKDEIYLSIYDTLQDDGLMDLLKNTNKVFKFTIKLINLHTAIIIEIQELSLFLDAV